MLTHPGNHAIISKLSQTGGGKRTLTTEQRNTQSYILRMNEFPKILDKKRNENDFFLKNDRKNPDSKLGFEIFRL